MYLFPSITRRFPNSLTCNGACRIVWNLKNRKLAFSSLNASFIVVSISEINLSSLYT